MSWGQVVEVMEPQWLRDELQNKLKKALSCYNK